MGFLHHLGIGFHILLHLFVHRSWVLELVVSGSCVPMLSRLVLRSLGLSVCSCLAMSQGLQPFFGRELIVHRYSFLQGQRGNRSLRRLRKTCFVLFLCSTDFGEHACRFR